MVCSELNELWHTLASGRLPNYSDQRSHIGPFHWSSAFSQEHLENQNDGHLRKTRHLRQTRYDGGQDIDDENYEVFRNLDFPDSGDNSLQLRINIGTVADYGRNDKQYQSWQEHKKPTGKVYRADHPPLDSKRYREFRYEKFRQQTDSLQENHQQDQS